MTHSICVRVCLQLELGLCPLNRTLRHPDWPFSQSDGAQNRFLCNCEEAEDNRSGPQISQCSYSTQALDWAEPYDIGDAREILGSFMPGKTMLSTTGLGSLRSRINVFCKYLGGEQKDAQKATPEAVLAFLRSRKTSQRDRTNYRLVLSRWLGWAADHGWLPANPIPVAKRTAVKKKRNRGEAVTRSPGQARDLLRAAIESGDPQVGAYVALSLFAGMRPEEFRGRARVNATVVTTTTNWEDLAERTVTVKPECAKTRMGRERSACQKRVWLTRLDESRTAVLTRLSPVCHPFLVFPDCRRSAKQHFYRTLRIKTATQSDENHPYRSNSTPWEYGYDGPLDLLKLYDPAKLTLRPNVEDTGMDYKK